MQSQSRKSSISMNQEITKVLIVYFENKIQNLMNRTVELSDIESLFTPFGRLSKILIYDRVE